MNALIANCLEYTFLRTGKRVDGTMYSCTSLGTKLGGGIGTAIAGWLLEISGKYYAPGIYDMPRVYAPFYNVMVLVAIFSRKRISCSTNSMVG